MTAYWLAQGVGVIAFLIGITTFINRDERRFRLQLAVYSAVIGVHFFLMGAAPAGWGGFEPPIRCRIHTFQACSFSHSDTSPYCLAAHLGWATGRYYRELR